MRRSQAAAGLLAGVERDARLVGAVRSALADELRPHCLHAALEGARLSLLTDGPAWASRLRFAAPELLAALAARGTMAAQVRIRVAPVAGSGAVAERPAVRERLSPGTVAHLRAAAAGMDDPELAAALLRLAGGPDGTGRDQETAKGRGA